MSNANMGHLNALLVHALGEDRARATFDMLVIDPALRVDQGPMVSRAAFAMAMNVALFDDLLRRVPSGAAYVADTLARGGKVVFDHGALRTVRFPEGPTGALPGGEDAFTRIFLPLGYEMAALYPLDRLKMTGRAYRHRDFPEAIPQFFLSELHVDRFDPEFAEAAQRVFGSSRDPLDAAAEALLARFAADGQAPLAEAMASLPAILAAFDRQHDAPDFADYQLLLSRSNEAAWIATEGNAFNHATDRVADVAALADRLKDEGRPMKERLEISASGRVRQTAFRADSVERAFAGGDARQVPGSFYEFISRDIDPETGRLDLAFDTGNATGIFAMTSAQAKG
ncbi:MULTISPECIES: 2-oxoadipate dioxygenase/decarboxylase family protein [unclassified Sphingobium]|uniref:2-oxoadipate dioxygenase/decarboxylase family protein n=1 Tax=unclassified Sphingobium TaxID=2611147 RepID=UPI0035A6318E